jgi:hypothetical protein
MLKKALIFLLLLTFMLIQATEGNEKPNYFQVYQENPTFENFKEAVEFYNSIFLRIKMISTRIFIYRIFILWK